MKKHKLIYLLLFSILLMLPAMMTNGQNGTAYQMKITGAAQVSCNVYEFDVTMNSTVPSNLVRMANFQVGILVNPAIVPAGATIDIALVPGSSTIPVASMRPGPEKFLYNNTTNCIQVAPVVPPGTANSFNLSMTGVKLFRVRVACSQPFVIGESTNHSWNFLSPSPYPTKVFGYISGINTDITNQASHVLTAPANLTLAGGYPDPIAQTVNTDITEFCNLPGSGATISLASTQAGYTYYLYSDGVRVPGPDGFIFGSGSPMSFSALASGSVMSVTSVGCVGEVPMLNTISLTPITPVGVSVTISANPGTTVAPGTMVTFTANPVNGGDFPFAIWHVNGIPDYNTFDVVYTYTPAHGDEIYCLFYPSTEVCTPDAEVASNILVMTVQTLPQEFIVSGGGTICQGQQSSVTLSGSETTYSYQLLLNGAPSGLAVQGTGTPLTWNVDAPGIYTVMAGSVMMAGSAEVIVIPTTTNTTVISACDSYLWTVNGQTYTASGIYTVVTGCHTEILDLTITPSTSNTTVASACDSYVWTVNGQTYTASGIYTHVTGCHTETLDLTITPSTSNTTIASACDSYLWNVNGQTYTASGIYTVVTGCHTEILDLTITPSTSNTTVASACDSYVWTVNGQTYTVSGIYTVVTGCHTEILDLTITPSTTNTTVISICNIYTWPVNGQTYTTSGIYTVVQGCNTEILDLTIIQGTVNTTTLTVCDSYTWPVNGQTYTQSGIYSETTGCDTEILELTVIPSTTNTTVLTECDSYFWPLSGLTYTMTGIYTNVTGCHTEILDLTIILSTSNTTVISECDSYTWAVTGQTYTTTGTYTEVTGCATEILDLTIIPSTTNTTVLTECDTYTWAVNGQTYTASGIYTVVTGCHTEILDLTIILSTSNTTVVSICNIYTWAVNGQTYTTSGIYTDVQGCHTEILDLTIIQGTVNTTTISVCDSYTWPVNGQTYTVSGIYSETTGCDTEILELTITPTTTNTTTLTVCDSYLWTVNGQTYTASGIYTFVTGCHTEILDLTIIPSTSNTTVASACDSYLWTVNGQTYTASGIFTVVTGCHTEILDLTVTPSTSNTTTISVCDSYFWAVSGQTYNATGIYEVVTGCHTEILDLTVTPSTSNTTNMASCNTYTWPVNGMTYTMSGTYTVVTGCHTEILNLQINPSYYIIESATIYDYEAPYMWQGGNYFTSGTYYAYYQSAAGCDSTYQLNLIVKASEPLSVSKNIGTAVLASWDPIPGAEMYQLRYRVAPAGMWVSVTQSTQLSRKIYELVPGTPYELQLRFRTGGVWQPWAGTVAPVFFTTEVVNFVVTRDIGTKFLLEWTELEEVSSYILQVKTQSSSIWTTRGYYPVNSAGLINMEEGETYNFRIIPRYDEVSFHFSQIGTHTANYITFSTSYNGGTSASFGWAPVVNPAASDYYLQIREMMFPAVFSSYYTNTNSRSVFDLIAGTQYEYRLIVRYSNVAWGATSWRLLLGGKEDLLVISPQNNLNVYPNPVSDIMTVEINSTATSSHTWNLYDVNGKLVMSGSESLNPGLNYFYIDATQLSTGLYMLQSTFNGTVESTRIIKQ
jgi:hypothetical protein